MKPPAFEYHRPDSLAEAVDVLARCGSGAVVLAGGQSLIPLLKLRFASPSILVDINNLPDLDYIKVEQDGSVRTIRECRDIPDDGNNCRTVAQQVLLMERELGRFAGLAGGTEPGAGDTQGQRPGDAHGRRSPPGQVFDITCMVRAA